MKVDWSKGEGWRIHQTVLDSDFVVVPNLRVLGDASRIAFVHGEHRGYIELDGQLEVSESGAVIR